MSLDATKNTSDIANYSAEFSQVRQALVTISNMKFNGIDLFCQGVVDLLSRQVDQQLSQKWRDEVPGLIQIPEVFETFESALAVRHVALKTEPQGLGLAFRLEFCSHHAGGIHHGNPAS